MFFQLRIADRKIYSHGPWKRFDVLVALTNEALAVYRDSASYIISEREVPLSEIAAKHGSRVMKNTAALGALTHVLGLDPRHVEVEIRREFRRDEKISDANVEVFYKSHEYAKRIPRAYDVRRVSDPRLLMSGAEALALGAVMSGMQFYSAYPMTPASPILHWLAEEGHKYGVVVVQPEDEIAAIAMAIGASYAGVRAATGTSGGGFDLMHEAFGLAAMIEVPVVVFLAQRGGPSTGLPTETEQSDLRMALHPAHGEFPHAVIAPRWIDEGPYAVGKAFNIAERYQISVIVLVDLYYTESISTVDFNPGEFKSERGKILKSHIVREEYRRYKITESGVSPRSIPGTPGGMYIATSDEHDERGDIITDRHVPEVRKAMHQKRMKKLTQLAEEMEPPLVREGEVIAVAWGSTSMPLMDCGKVGLALFRDIYPLPKVNLPTGAREVVVVEVNYSGQFAEYLTSRGVRVDRRVLKWWGEPFSVDELRELL